MFLRPQALRLCVFAGLAGCHSSRVVTGAQAESRFVYEGRPVHPLCVRFSLEQSSLKPNDLSACTDRTPANRDRRGWFTAADAPDEGRGNISYRVLAAKGDRFLLATDDWGGGTGRFSHLFWVRLSHGQVTDDRDERGGDRCAGGLSDFAVDGSTVRYNVSTPAKDILALAGVSVTDTLSRLMRPGYIDCDGEATYVYDPATYRSRFVTLTLRDDSPRGGADTGPSSEREPRACFDSLVRRYVAEHRQTLRSTDLQEFGSEFTTHCSDVHPARAGMGDSAKLEARTVRATSNPILADGRDYTADPATLVADGKLYIITGRDTAGPRVNDFKMPEWQMLVTSTDPMDGRWTHYPHLLRPEQVFKWAAPGRAYAAQIVQGSSGKFYLYAPVVDAAATTRDKFAIGVAVADSPLGPWIDAHPQGPVVSQSYPIANDIQNIDPTVLVDDDARVFLYWGTFGRLKGVELERDMMTFKGTPVDVRTLNGFFEASWLFKRNGTYYMAYAANTAGPTSECTEAVYYACIAYGTSPSPLGPWTYRGVILDPVSSTTSHPAIAEYKGKWYLVYHTADARNGGHFRRSVAIDRLEWDDGVTPPRIKKVVPTGGAPVDSTPIANIASHARVAASNIPVPTQYWLRAVNDGKVRASPLPPDMWATWSRNNPPQQWILYQWERPETLTGASLHFWGDHPAGSGAGVAPPKAWRLEYWEQAGGWKAVSATTPYTSTLDADNRVEFSPVTTRCLRAVFDASTDGATFAAVALQEWEVYSTRARPPRRPSAKGAATADCS